MPVAWLEGKADTIRTTNEARNEIIKKSGNNISNNLNIPFEYAEKAGHLYASKIIKQQINLDKIVIGATQEIVNNQFQYDDGEISEISDDWLNEFENYAKLKSSEDMQIIFSKILANEIHKPGKFKLKTLRTISQLTSEVANIFLDFCSISVTVIYDDKIVLGFSPEFGKSVYRTLELEELDLLFFDISTLKEYGLVMTDDISFNFKLLMHDEKFKNVTYLGDKQIILTPLTDKVSKIGLLITGNYLTDSGKELLSILNYDTNHKFINNLEKYFKSKDVKFELI